MSKTAQSNPKESKGTQKGNNSEQSPGTIRNNWKPPRGIRFFDQPQCPELPFGVQWRVDGKKPKKGFPTREKREAFARALVGSVKRDGVSAYRLDENEARAWRAFRLEVGEGADLAEIARHWLAHGKQDAPSVAVAVADFLAAKKAERVSPAALSHYTKWLGRFSAAFGERRVSSITRDEISPWLATLGLGDVTTRGHFVRVRGLFSWLVNCGVLAKNPCAGLRAPKVITQDVELYTLAQGRALFERNKDEQRELLGRLALEAFAGLRFSSAARITAAEIKAEAGGIVLPADKIKTERREFIDGLPANLWAWLAWSDPQKWKWDERDYMREKTKARIRAGLPETRNALRHSFCSYHIAAHKDPSRTSVILCHSSPRMLWKHYRGNATEEDGKAWFQILPPTK